ncbi:UMP kinase [Candidatus Uhrbacteria bacterium]|nr:UMP kinase [Candidatus Uhrbacteria bacterium]
MRKDRILLKLSGEALGGDDGNSPFNAETMQKIAKELIAAHDKGIEIGVVVGGGNVFRGQNGAGKGMNRVTADQIGMIATIQNGLWLRDAIEHISGTNSTRLMSGLVCPSVAEPYNTRRAMRHFEKRRIIIFVGGTGNPFCTTDYAAALRANEIEASLLAKATNVTGIFDKDPKKYSDAELLKSISYQYCLDHQLGIMDTEAFALCRDQKMPIRVFSLKEPGSITRVLCGGDAGTLVSV